MAMKGTTSTFNASSSNTIRATPKEKLVIISGSFSSKGWKMSADDELASKTGIHLVGQLQERFEEFARTHDIIDWHVTQESQSTSWSMFIRYKS